MNTELAIKALSVKIHGDITYSDSFVREDMKTQLTVIQIICVRTDIHGHIAQNVREDTRT